MSSFLSGKKVRAEHFEPRPVRVHRENIFSPLSYSESPSTALAAQNAEVSKKAPSTPRVNPSFQSSVGSILTDTTNTNTNLADRRKKNTNSSASSQDMVDESRQKRAYHNAESIPPSAEEELAPKRRTDQRHLRASMTQAQPYGSRVRPCSVRGQSSQIASVLNTPRLGENNSTTYHDPVTVSPPQQDPVMTIPSFNSAVLTTGGGRKVVKTARTTGRGAEEKENGIFAGCAYGSSQSVLHDVDSTSGRSLKKPAPHSTSEIMRLRKTVHAHVVQKKGGLSSLWVALTRGTIGNVRPYDAEKPDAGITLSSLQQQLSCLIGEDVQFGLLRACLTSCCPSNQELHLVSFRVFADTFGEVPAL